MNAQPMLEVNNIRKCFGEVEVLKSVSATINKGELVTFVGPSGCGKTTLLRIVGGLTSPTSGAVLLDGVDITNAPPDKRDTKMVFQSYALFPHMSVTENIAFGMKVHKWPKSKTYTRVDELLSLVDLEGLGDRRIDQLSGGQQQRVALARAVALEPKVLLLDEPLSNLDANLRLKMREEIRSLQERIGITTIFVTHDQYEAMSISDRIIVLKDGVIQQIGTPEEIYMRPANDFIAGFVGHVNLIAGKATVDPAAPGELIVQTKAGPVRVHKTQKEVSEGDDVVMVVRPEAICLEAASGVSGDNSIPGEVRNVMYAGSMVKYDIESDCGNLSVDQYNPSGLDLEIFKTGDKVHVAIPHNLHLLKE